MITLQEYATEKMIRSILIKERVKSRGKYVRRLKNKKHPDGIRPEGAGDIDFNTLAKLDLLTAMMPGREHWVRLKNRKRFMMPDGRIDKLRMYTKAIKQTIERDEEKRKEDPDNKRYEYLDFLHRFTEDIRQELGGSEDMTFSEPLLMVLYKKEEKAKDGVNEVTYRPLSVYNELRDKVILALTSKYITSKFNWYLHKNILSYRSARDFGDEKHRVTDFNDGIKVIKKYRQEHAGEDVYVADCDIKKFYDTINHDVVIDCFDRMLRKADLTEEGRQQVMRVMKGYLRSYNFYEQIYMKTQDENFWNAVKKKRNAPEGTERYKIGWISDEQFAECYGGKEAYEAERLKIGVPQGGSLSLMIADVVLNDVDKDIVDPAPFPDGDKDKLFIRFCDDMVLMHTDKAECQRLIDAYCKALTVHKLIYHDFTNVGDKKDGRYTLKDFWDVKSHSTFLWGPGEGDASEWIGFLGYEMRYDGSIRLRHSNVEKLIAKLRKQYFSTARILDNPETDTLKLVTNIEKTMVTLGKSLLFYTGLEDSVELEKQLAWLDQRRRYFVKRASCKAKSAQCLDSEADRQALSNAIRKYTGRDYRFKI